ncbi:ABC transporter permease [Paenibacillus gansuensis]|uniref:ABC transporter permease n=1 Tax=Paenibacillus gansuensis TaxID=306542 RepID=A0ABW5P7B4_9BACL
MTESSRAFLAAMKVIVSSRLAYRGDLYISIFVMLLGEAILPFITLLIYRSGASFPGWTLEEVMLLQGVFMLSKGIAYPFFYGMVYNTLDRVREGTFEVLLLKPRSAMFMTMVTGFSLDGIGRLLGGLFLFGFSLSVLPAPEPLQWAGFLLFMALSACVLFGSALVMSGILFHWVGSSRVYDIHDAVTTYGRYPRTIYSKPLQFLLSSLLPVAMISYFPSSLLLGKADSAMMGAAVSSAVFLAAAIGFWHYMLSKYTSAGG